jgi:eukaryotic-like serine/threonine-protein kinase
MNNLVEQSRAQQVKALFEAAVDLAPEARLLFLQNQTDDAELRAAVQKLLDAHAQAGSFLETSLLLNTASITAEATIGQRLGPYRLLCEIGRGGMAIVYLAARADDEFQQQVAIKLLWARAENAEVVRRFRQERQILAKLNHPNIARLLDGGTNDQGWPYLVMEYIEGVPLTRYCDAQGLNIPARLQLFQTVCAAVAYAHQHLVIHRDLKPSNILVSSETGGESVVKLLDFGIAKMLTPESRDDLRTRTGLLWLTPEYASPEQIREETITTASDVYSLGVLLYELLTGVRPHNLEERPLHEIIRALAEEDPLPPSQVATATHATHCAEDSKEKLQRRLRGDLDNIVLLALSKQAPPRYLTVEQLSVDIGRHLNGEPVLARPSTLTYRAAKYIKRHKAQTALLALLCLGLVFALWQWQVTHARERTQRQELYAAQLRQASAAWFEENPRGYDEILQSPPVQPHPGEEDLRGLEWRYLWQLGHRERLTIEGIDGFDYSLLDGVKNVLFTQTEKLRRFMLRDANTGRILSERILPGAGFTHAYTNENGRPTLLYQADNGALLEQDFLSGAQRPLLTDPSPITHLATDADGMLLTGHADGQVKQWERQTGRPLSPLFTAAGRLRSLQQTRDHERIAALTTDGVMQLRDVPQQRELLRLEQVAGFYLDRDAGNWMVVEFRNRLLGIYDLKTARQVNTLDTSRNPVLFISGQTQAPLIISHQDNTVSFYELPTLRLLKRFVGHQAWVNAAQLSDSRKWLATASSDRTVRLWDVATQRELVMLRGHQSDVMQVFWFDQDRQLASLSNDHVLKVWDVAAVLRPELLTAHKGRVFSVVFSSNGRLLASAHQERTVMLWDAETGTPLKMLSGHSGQVLCVNFSPDGRRLVASGEGRAARVWDVATGNPLFDLCCHQHQQHFVVFSPDNKLIATASDDKTIKLWDATNGGELRTLTGHTQDIWSLAFTPDSRTLASGTDKGEMSFWDVMSGQRLHTFYPHGDASVWSIAYTPDGQSFITASGDHTARLWHTVTRQLMREFKGHTDSLFELALSLDGQRLATASRDKTVRFWNVATGQQLLKLNGHTDQVWSVALAPDGNTLASGSWDRTVRLWWASPALPHQANRSTLNASQK